MKKDGKSDLLIMTAGPYKSGKKVLTNGGRGGILTKLSARAGGRDTDERKKLRIR